MRYVGRNLRTIDRLVQKSPLTLLDSRQYRNLLVVQELYRQQLEIRRGKKRSIPDLLTFTCRLYDQSSAGRIVHLLSLALSLLSVVTDSPSMEELSLDVFNEGITLQNSAEQFKERCGHYPAVIYADKI